MGWHEEQQAEIKEQQQDLSRKDIKEQLIKDHEHVFDPEDLKQVKHVWVKRGLVMSCEGAGHPTHQHFLR